MESTTSLAPWLQADLEQLTAMHNVPGASVAVTRGDELVLASAGVLSLATGVDVTNDSLFQIGSVTKIWTATLIMQLVDAGILDLDDPVTSYLPEFRTSDDALSRVITVRHLLSHTAGFEGDVFVDTGEGDDALAKLADVLADVRQVSVPGMLYSYSNAGYSVLGRVAEVIHGRPFDALLRENLAEPLDISHMATSAREAILWRAAVGHLPGPEGLRPTTNWSLMRSNAPAGATLCLSAADLATFGRMHLDCGMSAAGERVLSGLAIDQMRTPQVDMPYLGHGPNSRGLGWGVFDLDGGVVLGHNGVTIGQYAFLRVVPATGLVVSVLTNGGGAEAVHRSIFERLLAEDTGWAERPAPAPGGEPGPLDMFEGCYESGIARIEVSARTPGRLLAQHTPTGIAAQIGETPSSYELVSWDKQTFVLADRPADGEPKNPHVFLHRTQDGHAKFLYDGRIHARPCA